MAVTWLGTQINPAKASRQLDPNNELITGSTNWRHRRLHTRGSDGVRIYVRTAHTWKSGQHWLADQASHTDGDQGSQRPLCYFA